MTAAPSLHAPFEQSCRLHPERIAVIVPGQSAMSYAELGRLSDRTRDRIRQLGVGPGDRVGVHLRKSADTVAAILGILKAGAAYVPVDVDAPAVRCAYILHDCSVRVVFTEPGAADSLRAELARVGEVPPLLILPGDAGHGRLGALLDGEDARLPVPVAPTIHPPPDSLAYILYTSGSTGRPKGVMLTHRSATSFVDWCSSVFEPVGTDRFSSHAPFHFDLSILDLFVPLKHAASLVLIGDELGKDPLRLAPVIAAQGITVWYSTPSILSLLGQYGKLSRYEYPALRFVLFAGEVFPVPQLRLLKAQWPAPRYVNLYGPTETNVCTYYEIPGEISEGRTEPFPIGRSCEHLRCMLVGGDGAPVPEGEEGELIVTGPGVMAGYWNLPAQNEQAFLVSPSGERWYRTGDIAQETEHGVYIFRGRRDRMVKRRGYRVELGEIEAGLSGHPAAREVAVVAVPDADGGVRIKAYLSLADGRRPSIIELKQFCVERLPRYMAPDAFTFVEALPRTSTDKIDYQTLKAQG
jgi:amino acid adenylation domain-containing protein